MKYWIWICLELLVMFGTGAWVYFFPEDFLTKGVVGFGLLWLVKECEEINRRNKMNKNYTVEQNAGENQIEGGVVSIGGSVKDKHYIPFSFNCGLIDYCGTKSIWVKSKFDSNCVLQITGYTVDDEGKHCVWLKEE